VDIVDDIRCESSTAPSLSNFLFYAVATYKKAKTTEKDKRQKAAALACDPRKLQHQLIVS